VFCDSTQGSRFHLHVMRMSLREGHRVKVFENGALTRISKSKGVELRAGWRTCYSVEFHNLYYSTNSVLIFKSRMEWEGHVARMGENCIRFGGKHLKESRH
jgi:hypothetical protein